MESCCFLGHKNCPNNIDVEEALKKKKHIINLGAFNII